MARRPFRTLIGLGRLATRFSGSGPCIVKVKQQYHFAFLDKWLCFGIYAFMITKLFLLLMLRRGDKTITAVAYSF
jgi:hypothetical protein